ncbi:MAG: DUF58 domain-containing protein [Phototrophicales bacterium]|nr:DUF58 domain-containing protein [Phototrophicales bacterium]
MTTEFLLDDGIRKKLDSLMLIANKVRGGAIKGERRSNKRGTSIEFADYRNYTQGDDLRRLDWNVYARTNRPYIKVLEDEEDLAVHLLIDNSASMDFPNPKYADDQASPAPIAHNLNKFLYAKRLASALGYIALNTNDRMSMTALNPIGDSFFAPARGRVQSVRLLRFAQSLTADGTTDLNVALRTYALRAGRAGLCFVFTDMFSPSGYLDGFNVLLGKGHEVVLVHILSPEDLMPPMAGDLRLVDVETGITEEVSLDATLRMAYIRRVEAWRDEIRAQCAKRGVHYLFISTDMPLERVLLYDLRKLNIVK